MTAAMLASTALAGCQRSSDDELVVFAAASLTETFADAETEFESAHPGVDVRLNLAGSQVLATQLLEGARADVFASANATQVDRVQTAGRVGESSPFAINHLVVATPPDNPAGITTLDDLTRPGLRVVLAAPAVPAGDYARRALRQVGVEDAVLANLVSNEDSVRGVVSKLVLGEADAGIVYASDAEHATLSHFAMPDAGEVAVRYEIAAITDANVPSLADAFVKFAHSEAMGAILADHGLGAP
jgi:molybdate transport system substrate-binding protein